MPALINKIALVTGASSGIGRATAKLFAAEGAHVVVAARRHEKLEKLVAEIAAAGGKATALAGDVKDEAFAQSLSKPQYVHSGASISPSTMPAHSAKWGRRRAFR